MYYYSSGGWTAEGGGLEWVSGSVLNMKRGSFASFGLASESV